MNKINLFLIVLVLPLLFTMPACDDHSTSPTNSCAPLYGEFDPAATSYMVVVSYNDGIDHVAETNRLKDIYTLSNLKVYEFVPAFAAEITPEVLSAIRCEESIASVNENIPIPPAD